ncbi:hypothetical protein OIU78_024153 [Salix suchowensis]|nr:hypothetical protein OIU78_024153 [Salix suchowensis]
MASSSHASIAKLKVAGTWAGLLEVETENWTVPMLREEIAKRSNMGTESINLIFAGKVLKDGLMLHTSGKRFIRKQMFTEALEALTMGEEAFSLCNPKSIEVSVLLICFNKRSLRF